MPRICKPYLHRTDTVLIRLYYVSKLTMCKYIPGKLHRCSRCLVIQRRCWTPLYNEAGRTGEDAWRVDWSIQSTEWCEADKAGAGGAIIQSDIQRSSRWSPPRFPPLEDEWLTGGGGGGALDNQISTQRPSYKPLVHASITLSLQIKRKCASWIQFNSQCCILNYIIKLSVNQVHLASQQPVLHLGSNLTIKIGS